MLGGTAASSLLIHSDVVKRGRTSKSRDNTFLRIAWNRFMLNILSRSFGRKSQQKGDDALNILCHWTKSSACISVFAGAVD